MRKPDFQRPEPSLHPMPACSDDERHLEFGALAVDAEIRASRVDPECRDVAAVFQRVVGAGVAQGSIPDPVAERLAQALLDQDVYVRVHAAQCLERMGPRARESSAALIEALDDPLLAPQAALALGAIGAEQAVPFLTGALDRKNPFDLRLAAAWGLQKLAKSEAAPSLAPLLAPEEPADLRGAAAAALLRCGDSSGRARALQVLGQLLSAENLERSPLERALEEELARGETEIARRWRDLADLPDPERLKARAELVLLRSAELAGAGRPLKKAP